MSTKVMKAMVAPINLIFRYLQTKVTVQVWLFDQLNARIEGKIIGLDEFMNLVLDQAVEVQNAKKPNESRKDLGRIVLRGDTITMIRSLQELE